MTIVAPLLLTVLSGCRAFDRFDDRIARSLTMPNLELRVDDAEPWAELGLDELGRVTLDDHPLDLPRAQEDVRLGIHLVNLDGLPVQWRPDHAKDGGVMVTWLAEESPLAVAGLRPFDVIDECEPYTINTPEDFLNVAADKADGRTLRMMVRGPAGKRQVQCDLVGPYRESSSWSFPFLWYGLRSPNHVIVSCPILFTDEFHTKLEYDATGLPNYVTYIRKHDPLYLFSYVHRADHSGAPTTETVTILWFLKFKLKG